MIGCVLWVFGLLCGGAIAAVAMAFLVGVLFLKAWMVHCIWGWYLVPAGFDPLPIFAWFGILTINMLILAGKNKDGYTIIDEKGKLNGVKLKKSTQSILTILITYFLIWAMAGIVYWIGG